MKPIFSSSKAINSARTLSKAKLLQSTVQSLISDGFTNPETVKGIKATPKKPKKLEKIADLPVASAYYEPEEKLWRVIVEPKGTFNVPDGCRKNFLYEDGTPVSAEYFEFLSEFHCGWGRVGKRNKAGKFIYNFLNRNGSFISKEWYYWASDFENGVALVAIGKSEENCRLELIDITGAVIKWFSHRGYPVFQYPTEGILAVSTERPREYVTDYDELGNWGYVAMDGTVLVEPQFAAARPFEKGYAEVCRDKGDGDYVWGLIDRNGNEIIPCCYSEIKRLHEQENPWYRVKNDQGKWGILSANNGWIVQPKWGNIGYWLEGDDYIEVSLRDFWEDTSTENLNGLLRISDEKLVVPMEYTSVGFIRKGLYDVSLTCNEHESSRHSEAWLIDGENKNCIQGKRFRFVSTYQELPYSVRDLVTGKNGFMDESGNLIVDCKYNIPWNGENRKLGWFVHDDGNLVSILDFQERVILPPKFNYAHIEHENFIEVAYGGRDKDGKFDWQSGKFGLLDFELNEILPPIFKQISFEKDFLIAKDGVQCSVFRIAEENAE